MKHKRQKKVNKIMKYYELNFGFRKPYNVLVDGTFCVDALNNKVVVKDQITKYLEDVKVVTSGCCITEIENIGLGQLFGPAMILKNFSLFRCGHIKALSASHCIKSLIKNGNEEHLIIATQDENLRKELRKIPGVPLLSLHRSAPCLENPSGMTVDLTEKIADGLTDLTSHQKMILKELKKQTLGENTGVKKKKRKGPKRPNPLSCLKKKIKAEPVLPAKKKKRRKKKKSTENIET